MFLVDVRIDDGDVLTRSARRPSELARHEHAFQSPPGLITARNMDRGARDARFTGVFVQ